MYAFLCGYILLNIILLVPALHKVFAVTNITLMELLIINCLAIAPSIIIQFKKWINSK